MSGELAGAHGLQFVKVLLSLTLENASSLEIHSKVKFCLAEVYSSMKHFIKNHISGAKTSVEEDKCYWNLCQNAYKSKAELKELEIQELTSLVFRLYCIGLVLE